MFAIVVYDAGVKRDPKILKTCRRYLNWVQNSVFEGEITEGKYLKLKKELEMIINKQHDYVLIYLWQNDRYLSRIGLGTPKVEEGFIL